MARPQEAWNKKEAEKLKQKKRKEKEQKKEERRASGKSGSSLEDMIAYVDENGQICSTPPDPTKKIVVNEEDIQISVAKQKELEPVDLIRTGIVSFFNDSKGYGFIKDLVSQESIFVHLNGLVDPIKENNKVSFEVEKTHKGLSAVNVKIMR